MSIQYRKAYAKFGEERVQEVPSNISYISETVQRKRRFTADTTMSDSVQYWATRLDVQWSRLPGYNKIFKKSRTSRFFCTVPQILVDLEPANTFNPANVWQKQLEKEKESLEKAVEDEDDENGKTKSKATKNQKHNKKSKEDMKEENTIRSKTKKFAEEVAKIRNLKKELDKIDFKSLSMYESKAIYLVEVLYQAYNAKGKNKDKRLLFETIWAIERLGTLPDMTAPKTDPFKLKNPNDSALIYDNFKNVEKLYASALKIREKEKDMIKLQLTEMSDTLPPLSRFNFGYSLDPWQKRVLGWIDAGKSVVICAPTSSGKTVLSSYVAILSKLKSGTDTEEETPVDSESKFINRILDDQEVSEEEEEEEEDEGEEFEYDHFDETEPEEDKLPNPSSEISAKKDAQMLSDKMSQYHDETSDLVQIDRIHRNEFNSKKHLYEAPTATSAAQSFKNSSQKILFVVPTEPLVWQVAAYFTKLLRKEGVQDPNVAIVTDHMTFYLTRKFNEMPPIVVGTPYALETALTKPRGLTGRREVFGRPQGDILPGGFDHFDWVIYDEVHALDGNEGAALQRLIRSMNCNFLALSATVGNANQLRNWMERVKGEQIHGVEVIDAILEKHSVDSLPLSDIQLKDKSDIITSKTAKFILTQIFKSFEVSIRPDMTVAELKTLCDPHLKAHSSKVYESKVEGYVYPDTAFPWQILFKDMELNQPEKTLQEYGLFSNSEPDTVVLYVNTFLNLLTHKGRFINLQRYLWDQSGSTSEQKLKVLSPISAVSNIEDLKNGMLLNSSLSFTSKDSFRLWEFIESLIPSQCEEYQAMNPYNFFSNNEHISLQRTKDYEDILKSGLTSLAVKFPKECQEILYNFKLEDPPKELDICDLVLELKKRDMLPCLPFHLNTFEAIELFQHLLAGIEYRQKVAFPTYYLDLSRQVQQANRANKALEKSTGKNDSKLEELQKSGEIDTTAVTKVDQLAPHPDFTFLKGAISDIEIKSISDEMERYDGFEKREADAMRKSKGENLSILKHALIRGLKRGIGLFVDEISFSAYRRAVQRLASQGKLGVVISDDSLAFGVNMPFRTCVFCGEMFDQLDELMAQQMSGRAGRRGLDTQGNLVYAGIRMSRIRKLMIGTISNITGNDHNPRYDTLFLQQVLSPRHVGWNRCEVIGGMTLQEYVENREVFHPRYSLYYSRNLLVDLGFIVPIHDESKGNNVLRFVPNLAKDISHATLGVMWDMRKYVNESISIGMTYSKILNEFDETLTSFSLKEKKANAEKIEFFIFRFFVIFCLMIDRTTPASLEAEGISSKPITQLPYFSNEINMNYYNKWLKEFESIQASIPEKYSHLKDPVPASEEIDGTFFQCVYDRNHVYQLNDKEKQRIKDCIWHAGNILKALCNYSWPEERSYRIAFFIFRRSFDKLNYLNSELTRSFIDFTDVSSYDREKRVDTKDNIERIPQSLPWFDNQSKEENFIYPNSWKSAICSCVDHYIQEKAQGAELDIERLEKIVSTFNNLSTVDAGLVHLIPNLPDSNDILKRINDICKFLKRCSFGARSSLHLIGALAWFCSQVKPVLLSSFFGLLKKMYDENLLDESSIKTWYHLPHEELLQYIPSAYPDFEPTHLSDSDLHFDAQLLEKLKSNMKSLVDWLENAEEEEEEDDDEDDDEEDDDEEED